MKMNCLAVIVAACGLLYGSEPAEAHHSFSGYDSSKTIALKGTVAEFRWMNPHTWLELDVPGRDGKVVSWSFEGQSLNILARRGWKKDDFKPGEKLTVVAFPKRDGSPMGALKTIIREDGRSINADRLSSADPEEDSGPR